MTRPPIVTAESGIEPYEISALGAGIVGTTPGVRVAVSCDLRSIDAALSVLDTAVADVRRQLHEARPAPRWPRFRPGDRAVVHWADGQGWFTGRFVRAACGCRSLSLWRMIRRLWGGPVCRCRTLLRTMCATRTITRGSTAHEGAQDD